MSDIRGLLEVQAFDLEVDAMRARRVSLPEREKRLQCDVDLAALEGAASSSEARRQELEKAEHALADEVADVAAKVKDVEKTLYSGSVTAPKELEAFSLESRLLKARQSELEDRELELLEEMEGVADEVAANAASLDELRERAAGLDAAIRAAETEIDEKIEGSEAAKSAASSGLPPAVLEAYAKLREHPRLAGRACAELEKRSCGGCRVDQPVLECKRILGEPWDAVVKCVHCGRLIVR